jgi:branched-chain amino acid transport system substrate-binding protein
LDTIYGSGYVLWLENLMKSGAWKPKGKTAAIVWSDDPYDAWIATQFREAAKRSGWKITADEKFTYGQVTDWGPLFSPVRANPPAVVFTADFVSSDDAAMAKYWASNPLPALLYQQFGPSVPEYLELAGDAANGIIWSTILGWIPDKMGQDFKKRYEAKFKESPGWANAAGCYDEVMVWAHSVALAGTWTDKEKLFTTLESIVHRGITGGINFTRERHWTAAYPHDTSDPSLGQSHFIIQIQNKQHKIISPAPYQTGEYQTPPWM